MMPQVQFSSSVRPKTRVKSLDNPSPSQLTVTTLASFAIRLWDVMVLWNIRYESIRDLSRIVQHYSETGEGCNVYKLLNYCKDGGESWKGIYARLNGMEKKGLIQNVSAVKPRRYIPTAKALKELQELCRGA